MTALGDAESTGPRGRETLGRPLLVCNSHLGTSILLCHYRATHSASLLLFKVPVGHLGRVHGRVRH